MKEIDSFSESHPFTNFLSSSFLVEFENFLRSSRVPLYFLCYFHSLETSLWGVKSSAKFHRCEYSFTMPTRVATNENYFLLPFRNRDSPPNILSRIYLYIEFESSPKVFMDFILFIETDCFSVSSTFGTTRNTSSLKSKL